MPFGAVAHTTGERETHGEEVFEVPGQLQIGWDGTGDRIGLFVVDVIDMRLSHDGFGDDAERILEVAARILVEHIELFIREAFIGVF